jgi:SHS2 domain-containing protein
MGKAVSGKKGVRTKKYRFIDDLTSDVMFEAYGKTLKSVFENAAEALLSVICQIKKVKPKVLREVEMEAESVKELMFDWLQELIARVDVEDMFFSKFQVTEVSDTKLRAKIWGEEAKPEKGETVVKALTYYGYEFEKEKARYRVKVAMDI